MSPTIIGVLSVVGVALTAVTATVMMTFGKFKAMADSKIQNDQLRAAVDLGLHLVAVVGQASLESIAADLTAGRIAQVTPNLCAKVKQLAATEGSETAQKLISMGDAYLSDLVKAQLAKLAAGPVVLTATTPPAAPGM